MSLATLLVLADGRLPAGGHAHSGGLEAAVATRRVTDLRSLEGFLRGRLSTAGLVSAAFAASACAHAANPGFPQPPSVDNRDGLSVSSASLTTPPKPGWGRSAATERSTENGRLAELDAGLDARTPSPALRRASRAQGRALMRAGRAMWPVPAIGREPHHPIALGVVAAAAGLTPEDAAVAAAYGSLTGPATGAVRLLGLDPYGAHALLAALAPECDKIAADAAAHANNPVGDLPAASSPLLDLGAENHATWEVRLFAS